MMKPGFATSTVLRFTRSGYRWGCCASSPRGRWDVARSRSRHTDISKWEHNKQSDDKSRNYERSQRNNYKDATKDQEYDKRRYDRKTSPHERDDIPRRDDWHSERRLHRRVATNPETVIIRETLDSGDEVLYGVNPVLQALYHNRRTHFTRVFTQERSKSLQKGDNQISLSRIIALAKEREIPVVEVSKGGLNALCGGRVHQGVVLATGNLPIKEISSLQSNGIWLALDEVNDPHNVGAIIRSGVFFGISGILVCKKNCCGITATVSKCSAGCVEGCEIGYIKSMPRFLRGARESGWHVIGMDCDGEDIVNVRIRQRSIIVVGNEGDGIRKMVREECDQVVRIPSKISGNGMVDSLNVSVATGVALFQLVG